MRKIFRFAKTKVCTYADVEEFRNVVLPLWDKFADSVGGIDFVNAAKAALGY